jgi:hypothetical protein
MACGVCGTQQKWVFTLGKGICTLSTSRLIKNINLWTKELSAKSLVMGGCQAWFREKGGWNSLHLLDSRTEILVPFAAIQAVPIAVIAWYRLHRYAWYRYSAIVTERLLVRQKQFKLLMLKIWKSAIQQEWINYKYHIYYLSIITISLQKKVVHKVSREKNSCGWFCITIVLQDSRMNESI